MAKAKLFDGSTVTFDYTDIEGIDVEPGDEGKIYSLLIRWKNYGVDRAESIIV